MRKICVVIGSRANYSSIKSVMKAVKAHPELELQLVASASALIDRYGKVVDHIQMDGFTINEYVYMLVEGENPTTMAKSTGLGLLELPTVFTRLQPDVVLTVGDRFETMATVLAAVYMNIPLAHTMGGEVSGTVDESIRHAVTKFAHIHFPACSDAQMRIIRMGEQPERVHLVGCPRIDLVSDVLERADRDLNTEISMEGVGGIIDINKPFLLISQHPVTTEYGSGEQQITETLKAVYKLKIPAIILWPNADAGSEDLARGMRKFREKFGNENIHFSKSLTVENYIRLMANTSCLVGNSSSGIREGAFVGTPVVNIGTRQANRQRGNNVLDVDYSQQEIEEAIITQINNGRYASQPIYGDGKAGQRIASILVDCPLDINKKITY